MSVSFARRPQGRTTQDTDHDQTDHSGLDGALVGYEASIQELLDEGMPSVVHLSNPDHFVAVAGGTGQNLQVWDGGWAVVPRVDLERRFTGHALVARRPGGQGPRVEIDEPDLLLRPDAATAKATYAVSLKNRGTAPLTVAVIQASCSCTLAETIRGPIPPGDSRTIHILVEQPRNYAVKWVELSTNDPGRPRAILSLRYYVPQRTSVEPESVTMRVDYGQGSERELVVRGESDLGITRAVTSTRYLTATYAKLAGTDGVASAWQVRVTCSTAAPVGAFDGSVVIHTTDFARPTITLPVRVTVRGDLQLVPAEAFLGFVKAGERTAGSISLRSRSGRAFQIRDVRGSDPGIRASWIPAPESTLKVEFQPNRPGPIDGYVELTTDVPGQETIRVPVSGLVE